MDLLAMIDIQAFTDCLSVGALGFVGGVLIPWAFRLVGYVVDSARLIVK